MRQTAYRIGGRMTGGITPMRLMHTLIHGKQRQLL